MQITGENEVTELFWYYPRTKKEAEAWERKKKREQKKNNPKGPSGYWLWVNKEKK
jgi:hypothetical protein